MSNIVRIVKKMCILRRWSLTCAHIFMIKYLTTCKISVHFFFNLCSVHDSNYSRVCMSQISKPDSFISRIEFQVRLIECLYYTDKSDQFHWSKLIQLKHTLLYII